MESEVHLLLVDDHAVIRTGLKYLLSRHFGYVDSREADSCSGMRAMLEKHMFTHLIVDLQLGDCNSMDMLADTMQQYPNMRVLVYTMSPEAIYGKRLIQKGVSGFLSKQSDEATVLHALSLFLQNRPYFSESLKNILRQEGDKGRLSGNPFDELSERELVVFRYLLQGLRVKEIANRMDLKSTTVATYKVRIFEKLGVDNLADMQRLSNVYQVD